MDIEGTCPGPGWDHVSSLTPPHKYTWAWVHRCISEDPLNFSPLPFFSDFIVPIVEMYDGTNEQECYKRGQDLGYFHSPIPDPQNFILGILSTAEKDMIQVPSPITSYHFRP